MWVRRLGVLMTGELTTNKQWKTNLRVQNGPFLGTRRLMRFWYEFTRTHSRASARSSSIKKNKLFLVLLVFNGLKLGYYKDSLSLLRLISWPPSLFYYASYLYFLIRALFTDFYTRASWTRDFLIWFISVWYIFSVAIVSLFQVLHRKTCYYKRLDKEFLMIFKHPNRSSNLSVFLYSSMNAFLNE